MRKSLCLLFVLALLIGACDSDNQPPSDSSSQADGGPTEIEFQVSGEPEETAVYTAVAKAFEQENEGTTVQVIEVPDGGDHLAKLATSFAGGAPPDIFLINYREYAQFVAQDAVEPIEQMMVDRGVDLADYYEQSLEAFRFEGTLQCMPQNISSLVVYYNADLFKKAGIKPPHDGWTFDEFREAAIKLSEDGVDGVGFDPKIIRLAPFIWSNGGELTDDPESPSRFTLDDPAAREVLDAFADLVRDEKVVPTEEEVAAQDLETRFIKGKLGMFLSSRVDTPVFREVRSGLQWDVLPLPTFDEPASILHSDAFCISAGADEVEAAADFVAFAMSEQGQTLMSFSGRTVPSLISVAESPAFLDPAQPPEHSEVWLNATPVIRNTPIISTWPEIESLSEELLIRLFYEDDYSVDRFLQELDDQTRPLFEEARG